MRFRALSCLKLLKPLFGVVFYWLQIESYVMEK